MCYLMCFCVLVVCLVMLCVMCHVLRPVKVCCICQIGFCMILMYISQANKVPARSLDVCLGEGVAALMPAPPISPVTA